MNNLTFLKPSHSSHLPAYEDGIDSVLKRRHTEFRRRGITQKKAYDRKIFIYILHPTGSCYTTAHESCNHNSATPHTVF